MRLVWRLLGQIASFAALGVILSLPLVAAFRELGAAASTDLSRSPLMALYPVVAILLAALASLWLAGRWLDRRPFADFGLRLSRAWALDLAFGLILGAGLMAGIFLVEWAAGWIAIDATFEVGRLDQPFWLAFVTPLITFVCVGIYEEALARGYWLHNLAEGLNLGRLGERAALLLAWLISSVLFGLAHLGNPYTSAISTANLVLAGAFLGLGLVLTGRLAIPIGVHITWNLFEGNVFGFPVSGTALSQTTVIAITQAGPELWTGGRFGPEAGLVGVLALLVGSGLTLVWVWRRSGRLSLCTRLARYAAPVIDNSAAP